MTTPDSHGLYFSEQKMKPLRCMIRSLLNKTTYELLNGRKPKLTHLRTSGCKCYVLNNGKDQLEIVHVIFDESYPSYEKSTKDDQDGEPLLVLCEVIDMTNGKVNMMSQAKEPNEDNAASFSREPGTSITTTKVEERVVDAVQGTLQVLERRIRGNQSDIPSLSLNKPQMPDWKHKISHPLNNIITPLDSGVQTRSKAKNSLTFSSFLSQIESKNIEETLKDADCIIAMQDKLHQFKRNNGNTTTNKARLVVQGYNQDEGIDYDKTVAPVARIEAIRIVIAFVSHMEFTLFQNGCQKRISEWIS
ncbi:uncharacterized protein [Nicotiana sylvestris]|uniref:uncharacterized protein n=1 Tax=Nicotiana sylvestris TaxID=4096 RepID=UPI00388CB306